jgi:hypothetical protein
MVDSRRLQDLRSVGPATVTHFAILGIRSVRQLAGHEPVELFRDLCQRMNTRLDPCVLDVFAAAVAQARDPELPHEMRDWWYWSRQRKAQR